MQTFSDDYTDTDFSGRDLSGTLLSGVFEHCDFRGADHWNKRFDANLSDLVDFQGRRGKVIVEQGAYKAYHMPIWYRHALSVSWYVVGDIAWVREMLGTVTHLGKKVSQGWGAVLSWEVIPFPYNWSVYGEDGKLMRAIPDAGGILAGFRPSYWMRKNQALCKMPG